MKGEAMTNTDTTHLFPLFTTARPNMTEFDKQVEKRTKSIQLQRSIMEGCKFKIE